MAYQTKFSDTEWNLLVGLPQAVLTAASAAEDDGARRTRAEGESGVDAISDGRVIGNGFVEEIARELISRVGDPERGEEPPVVISPADPSAMIAECLDRAKAATALLNANLDEGDAGAYRHWLVMIAEAVVSAAPSVSAAEQRFVHRLTKVLQD